jgi:hypothetical protein
MTVEKEDLDRLKAKLPKDYAQKIKDNLAAKGMEYKESTIKAEISGKHFTGSDSNRKPNLDIIAAGYEVAKQYQEYLENCINGIKEDL